MKQRRPLPSPIVKRSVTVDGRKSSVGLEDGFWNALKEIATARKISIQEIVLEIDSARDGPNLSSAIRLFVLDHYRSLHTPTFDDAPKIKVPPRHGLQPSKETKIRVRHLMARR
jgi:predicted DNA-binding ribbon-helix-helix protein